MNTYELEFIDAHNNVTTYVLNDTHEFSDAFYQVRMICKTHKEYNFVHIIARNENNEIVDVESCEVLQ